LAMSWAVSRVEAKNVYMEKFSRAPVDSTKSKGKESKIGRGKQRAAGRGDGLGYGLKGKKENGNKAVNQHGVIREKQRR